MPDEGRVRVWCGVVLAIWFCALCARADDALPASANKICLVMKDQPTRADRFVDYQGKRIYFCCEKCIARFQREPAKFIASSSNSAAEVAPPLQTEGKPSR